MTAPRRPCACGVPRMRGRALKHCAHCHEYLPPSEYSRQAASPDGRRTICRSCDTIDRRTHARTTRQRRPTWRAVSAALQQIARDAADVARMLVQLRRESRVRRERA